VLLTSQPAADQSLSAVTDIVISFAGVDGTPLEGKLSVPANVSGRAPVVFHLHGAGPRTYDHAIQHRGADGQVRVYRYYDFYAQELGRRGLAFFRISKRGVSAEPSGRPVVDRAVFSKATPTVLLDDYARALDALRARPEVDPGRIILSGASEGTRLAPELALRSPAGIVGLVLAGYAADNQRDTVVWQNTVGPWRNIVRLFPAAADGELTRAEYDAAAAADPQAAARAPFAALDGDASGTVTAADMTRLAQPRLEAILKAVADRNDDLIWQAVVNLSSAYLLDGWDAPPHDRTLVKLDVPIGIFHGELDGATRVEGVHEAESTFRAAGKTNLTVHVYPGHDHDLNWTVESAARGGPTPFVDMFAFMARLATGR
jgi:hypothetical protein